MPPSFAGLTGITTLRMASMAHIVGDADASTVGSMAWICEHMPRLKNLDVSRCNLDEV